MTEYPPIANEGSEDDVPIDAPDVVPPSAGTPGNIPTGVLPETQIAYYSYELDIADTAMIWLPGAAIDTGMVRQYLVDRGYTVTSVDAVIGDDGLPNGLLTVRTNEIGVPIYAPVSFTIEDETETNTTAISTSQVKIADTAIATLPSDATFAGDVLFAADLRRSVATGTMGIVPVINGVDQTYVSITGDTVDSGVSLTLPVSGLAGGTAPTFGLKYRGGTTAGTTYIHSVEITGTLVDGATVAATQVTVPHWAAYDGSRYTGLVETIIVWTATAEGLITSPPDLPRITQLWQYLEQNDVDDIRQITGGWNFTTPETAPVSPELHVFARGAVDTDVSDAFLYSEISAADLDAFDVLWSNVETLSTLTRKVSGSVFVDQYESSVPLYFGAVLPAEPTGDVRDGDVWKPNGVIEDPTPLWRMRINGEWIELSDGYVLTNENSSALGRRSIASGPGSTATGVNSEASGVNSTATGFSSEASGPGSTATGSSSEASGDYATATGTEADATGVGSVAIGYFAKVAAENGIGIGRDVTIPSTSPRSIGIGYEADVPASTPDTTYLKSNDEIQVRSNGTGKTRKGLYSPDGTIGWIEVTNADGLLVNGTDVGSVPAAALVAHEADTSTHGVAQVAGTADIATHAALTTSHGVTGNVVGTGGAQTLSGPKTLTAPVIADFTASQHDHSNAAGGGKINDSGLVQTYPKVIFRGIVAVNPPSIAANTDGNVTVTVTGAAVGDTVIANQPSATSAGLIFNGCRAATDGVVLYFRNITASAIDMGSLNYTICVLR